MKGRFNQEKASIELIVLGLLAALIVVLCVPLLSNIGQQTAASFSEISSEMTGANSNTPSTE